MVSVLINYITFFYSFPGLNNTSNASSANNDTVISGPTPSSSSSNSSNDPLFSKTDIKNQFLKKHLTKKSRRGDNYATIFSSDLDDGGGNSRLGYVHEIDPILDYLFSPHISSAKSPQFPRGTSTARNNKLTKALTTFIMNNMLKGKLSEQLQVSHPVLYGKAYAMEHDWRKKRKLSSSSSLQSSSSGFGKKHPMKIQIAFSKWNKTVPF